MKEFVQEEVSKRFKQLPDVVQSAILSEELANALHSAMHTAELTKENITICNQQATLVMVGLATTVEFKKNIESEMSLDKTVAQILFEDISANVFNPVRKSLLDVLEKNDTSNEKNIQPDPYKEQVV